MKRVEKYFAKHVYLNSMLHLVGGIGLGVLLTRAVFDPHPVRYGTALVVVALLGHFYAYNSKVSKK